MTVLFIIDRKTVQGDEWKEQLNESFICSGTIEQITLKYEELLDKMLEDLDFRKIIVIYLDNPSKGPKQL